MTPLKTLPFILLLLLSPPDSRDMSVDVLVPAYGNPCCGGGMIMWSELIAAAADPDRNFQVHVIFNPASGPGATRDPNYLTEDGTGPLNDFCVARGVVHGYVATGYGDRALAEVKAEVDAYLTGHYGGHVDGIFFDEMSNDLADVGYYQTLQAYVKGIQPVARTFGNPGTTSLNNPSGQMNFNAKDFIDALDTVMTFEGTGADYLTAYTPFDHLQGLDRGKIAHVVHTQAAWNATLLNLASGRGAGFLYVTDDVMPPDDNPYDTLAGYWDQFLVDLSAHNAAQAP